MFKTLQILVEQLKKDFGFFKLNPSFAEVWRSCCDDMEFLREYLYDNVRRSNLHGSKITIQRLRHIPDYNTNQICEMDWGTLDKDIQRLVYLFEYDLEHSVDIIHRY